MLYLFFTSSIVKISTSRPRFTTYPNSVARDKHLNRAFIAIEPVQRSEEASDRISSSRLFLRLLAREVIRRLGPNANTLRGGPVLERERNRLMKTASARREQHRGLRAANGPNAAPPAALSLDEQRGVSRKSTHR